MIDVSYQGDLNINHIYEKIKQNIKCDKKRQEYLDDVRELLEFYNYLKQSDAPVGPNNHMAIFGQKEEFIENNPEENKRNMRKLIIISRFLEISKFYHPINVKKLHNTKIQNICFDCGGIRELIDDEFIICKNCDSFTRDVDTTKYSFNEPQTFTSSNKSVSRLKEESMVQTILAFQGKQTKIPLKQDIEKIEQFINKKSFIRDKLTVYHIRSILQELKLVTYYNSTNYIHMIITNKPCPEIKDYEDRILERHRILLEEVKNKNISTPRDILLLRSFLQMEGFKCNSDYFSEVKTSSVRDEFNMNMKNICREIQKKNPNQNWKFVPI